MTTRPLFGRDTSVASAHLKGYRDLPGIVLAHTVFCLPLNQRDAGRVGVMHALPPETAQEFPHRIHVPRAFQHLRDAHGTDPKPGLGVAPQPRARRARRVGRDLIEQINEKRRIPQRVHFGFLISRRLSPIIDCISSSKSADVVNGFS